MLSARTDECLPWPHSLTDRGYPQMTHPSGTRYAHRGALLETVGPCPDGMEAAHTCGMRSCVNPRHLRWATPSENNYDRSEHGTMPRGETHHWGGVPDSVAAEAIRRYGLGEDATEIGADLGIHRATVQRWGQSKSRRHLSEGA